jgi:hypothetical protein
MRQLRVTGLAHGIGQVREDGLDDAGGQRWIIPL